MNDCTKVMPYAKEHWHDGLTCPFCGEGAGGVVKEGKTYAACDVCVVYWDFGFDLDTTRPEELENLVKSLVGYAWIQVALPWCEDD